MFASALIVEPDRDASTAYLLTRADRALRIDYAQSGRAALFKVLEHPRADADAAQIRRTAQDPAGRSNASAPAWRERWREPGE